MKTVETFTGLNELETEICRAIIGDTPIENIPSISQVEIAIYSKAVAVWYLSKELKLQAEIAALKAERDKLKNDVDILNIMLHDTLNPSPPNESKEQSQPPEQ